MYCDKLRKQMQVSMVDRELIHHNTKDDGYEMEDLDVLRGIQYIALMNGFDITLKEADDIWSDVSYNVAASWLNCHIHNPEAVWSDIKVYFPERKYPDVGNPIEFWKDHNEYDVNVTIGYKKK